MKKLILIAALTFSPAAFAELAFDKAVGIFERYAHQCDKKAYRNHMPTECVLAAKYAKTLGEMYKGGYVISKESDERAVTANYKLKRAVKRIYGE